MLHGLIPFLIFAIIVLVCAYAVIYVLNLVPDVPAGVKGIARLIVGVIALVLILTKGLPLLGINVAI